MNEIKILIADDHNLIFNGISDMLRDIDRFKIIGHAVNGNEAIEKAIEFYPNLIFMDISMPELNGIEATEIITRSLPNIKIIALTQHDEIEYVKQFLGAGGQGYLLKNSSKEEFVNAIETVMLGKKYLSKQVSEQMLNEMLADTDEGEKPPITVKLTRRETEIIQKIADELSNQEIADELFISLRTVETHRRNIMQKLKVKSVVALIKYAAQNDIIDLKKGNI